MPIATRKIEFKSSVSAGHRAALERLVFFNSCQTRVWEGIVDAVEKFGPPEITTAGDRLSVRLRDLPDVQCVFAVDATGGLPLGAVVYMRPDQEHIMVLHVGISAEFASGGRSEGERLLLRLLREVRRSTRRVKGVRRLELFYAMGRQRHASRERKRVLA